MLTIYSLIFKNDHVRLGTKEVTKTSNNKNVNIILLLDSDNAFNV